MSYTYSGTQTTIYCSLVYNIEKDGRVGCCTSHSPVLLYDEESASASPDVITLFCLCWHVEGWNIVIEMHYHPSLNWDQSQAGLCKLTLIWESVCPGQRCQEELAGKLSAKAKSLWLQPWRACAGPDVGVALHFHSSWHSSSSVWKSWR